MQCQLQLFYFECHFLLLTGSLVTNSDWTHVNPPHGQDEQVCDTKGLAVSSWKQSSCGHFMHIAQYHKSQICLRGLSSAAYDTLCLWKNDPKPFNVGKWRKPLIPLPGHQRCNWSCEKRIDHRSKTDVDNHYDQIQVQPTFKNCLGRLCKQFIMIHISICC